MSDALRIALQVGISILVVIAVLYAMWRLPRKGDALDPWAPPLALASAWSGLLAAIVAPLLWLLPKPDLWLVALFLVLDPLSLTSGILVHWLYRDTPNTGEARRMHMTQATVGITLGLIALSLGYLFVMTHKSIGSAVGE